MHVDANGLVLSEHWKYRQCQQI